MTEPHNSKSHEEELTPDEKKTFDMYHFINRWDMMLAAAVIVVLILAGIYFFLTGVKTT